MADLVIQPLARADLGYVSEKLTEHFGSDRVVSRGQRHECLALAGFIAWLGGERVGFVQYHVDGSALEVVTLASDKTGLGIGRLLLSQVVVYCRRLGFTRCWLITTNNNETAIAFYKKLGWRLVEIHADAVANSRRIKPEIPTHDSAGVPICDEFEFEYPLEQPN